MPTYALVSKCEANARVVEVNHRMNEEIRNWGELCSKADLEPVETPPDSPVKRLAIGAM